MQVLAKEVIYTNEGTWALLNDESSSLSDDFSPRLQLAACGEAWV